MPGGQRAGVPQARHAGPQLQEQRGHSGDLRPHQDVQAPRLRQVRVVQVQSSSLDVTPSVPTCIYTGDRLVRLTCTNQ